MTIKENLIRLKRRFIVYWYIPRNGFLDICRHYDRKLRLASIRRRKQIFDLTDMD